MRIRAHLTNNSKVQVRRTFSSLKDLGEGAIYDIEYNAPYAVPVHERLDLIHEPPTQAKFIEQPFRELRGDMVNSIRQAIKRDRVSFKRACFEAIEKVFQVTQILVPVDTGLLKSSGRIVENETKVVATSSQGRITMRSRIATGIRNIGANIIGFLQGLVGR